MKQIICVITILIIALTSGYAENNNTSAAIKIGDKVPEVYLKHLHNWSRPTEKLSSFYKEKPLIIAFWATYCGTCLRSFPKLDSLRRINNNNFNVLSVAQEKNDDIIKLFNSVKILQHMQLPYLSDDTVMNHLFPHVYIPHVIWINTKGIVVAVTTEDEVTNESVQEFVANNDVHLYEKDDDFSFDIKKPYEPLASSIQTRSVFGGYNSRISGSLLVDAGLDSIGDITDSVTRLFYINCDALTLLFTPFAAMTNLNNYTLPIETRIINNSTFIKFDSPENDSLSRMVSWKLTHLFCYDLITKPETKTKFFQNMLSDLNNNLPVRAVIEKRMMPCYNLVETEAFKRTSDDMQPAFQKYFDSSAQAVLLKIQSMPVSTIVSDLNAYTRNIPICDKTSDEAITLALSLKIKPGEAQIFYDEDGLKTELKRNGFDLVLSQALMDVLVIEDKKEDNQ